MINEWGDCCTMMSRAIDILRKWDKGVVPPPEEVQLYPTHSCNLRCVFCVSTTGFYRGKRDIPTERWLSLAQELCDLGTGRVLISGGNGEPLLSPATLPMMALFRQHRVCGRMITNGTLWTGSSIRQAVEMGWDQITFSLDGPNAAVHDRLRGVPGCFDRAVSAIREFGKVKEERGSGVPRLEINCVLSRTNYAAVGQMVALAIDLGVSKLHLEPVCINSPAAGALRIGDRERKELQRAIFPEALRIAEEHSLSTNIRGLMQIGHVERAGEMRGFILDQLGPRVLGRPFHELACYEPWLWPKIEANGDVWPCSTMPLTENIREKSFADIWNGETFKDYRRRIMERHLPENCQNCVVSHLHTHRELRAGMRAQGAGNED